MSQARLLLDAATSEADFQRQVTELAELAGWQVLHVVPVTDAHGRTRTPTSIRGWPDLLLWRPGQVIAAELKTEKGRVTAEQKAVLASLAAAGIDTYVWRPSDWPQIQDTITTKGTP